MSLVLVRLGDFDLGDNDGLARRVGDVSVHLDHGDRLCHCSRAQHSEQRESAKKNRGAVPKTSRGPQKRHSFLLIRRTWAPAKPQKLLMQLYGPLCRKQLRFSKLFV